MVYLNVLLTVKNPDDVAEIRTLLAKQRELSLQEPGCLRFEVYQSENDPTQFILNEHWTSQAALDQHRVGMAFSTVYKPFVIPRVDRTSHPCHFVE